MPCVQQQTKAFFSPLEPKVLMAAFKCMGYGFLWVDLGVRQLQRFLLAD